MSRFWPPDPEGIKKFIEYYKPKDKLRFGLIIVISLGLTGIFMIMDMFYVSVVSFVGGVIFISRLEPTGKKDDKKREG